MTSPSILSTAIYRRRDLIAYLFARFLSEAAALGQSVAVGWTVYQRTRTPLALGIAGMAQFVPLALLMLPAGELCDRWRPRRLFAAALTLQGVCPIGFFALTSGTQRALWPLFIVLMVSGAARAFAEPAGEALLPFLVARERLPRAIAWASSVWQLAVIAGPALGGLAFAVGAADAYGLCAVACFVAALSVMTITGGRDVGPVDAALLANRIGRIAEGVRFVRSQPVIVGALSLDLVAVLLGGATALLPVYARDILHVGPTGLGLLRSAPAVGACGVALYQARFPLRVATGPALLAAVAAFGLATIVFAVSRALPLSLVALVWVGATDMVSVNIRSSLVQLATPDTLRGRVSAVNMLLVGTSSELGAFESGLLAWLIGTVPAVLVGGVCALLAAGWWLKLFPALRTAGGLPTSTSDRGAAHQ